MAFWGPHEQLNPACLAKLAGCGSYFVDQKLINISISKILTPLVLPTSSEQNVHFLIYLVGSDGARFAFLGLSVEEGSGGTLDTVGTDHNLNDGRKGRM